MHTLAVKQWPLPGEPGFPLNAMYQKPSDRSDEGAYERQQVVSLLLQRYYVLNLLTSLRRYHEEIHAATETGNGSQSL